MKIAQRVISTTLFVTSALMCNAHAGTISLVGVNSDFIDDHDLDIESAIVGFDFPAAYPGTDVTIDMTYWTEGHEDCNTSYFDPVREICARPASDFPSGQIFKLGPTNLYGRRDIIINEDVSWCFSGPMSCSSGFSFPQTVMHALALSAGFTANSPDTTLALSMANYPFGGEAGTVGSGVHLTEWDYVQLRDMHPDGACDANEGPWPRNFALSSYRETTAGNSVQSWQTDNENTFDLSDNAWVSPAGPPADVRAFVFACPDISYSSTITWSISQNGCDINGNAISPGYVIGTRTPSMSSGTPYVVGPNSWNFSGVPNLSRSYYMCVKIVGGADTLSGDNRVMSTDHFMRVRP